VSATHVAGEPIESLPRLQFAVDSAQAAKFAAAPTVALALRLDSDLPIRSVALNAQIRIAPAQRPYDLGDEARLVELFGTRERWGETLRGFVWTQVTCVVPPFAGSTVVELLVPATYDLEVASAKYFHALAEGDIPLELLFSGTVFYLGDGGLLRASQIPWECEAAFRLPVRTWREAMDNHFPGAAWVRLRRDVFDRLVAYRAGRTLPTWDDAVSTLLDEAGR
jgi:hypothetical protein